MKNFKYKIYASVIDNVVVKVFNPSIGNEQLQKNDVLLEETTNRHKANEYYYIDNNGIYTKTIKNGKLVDRDIKKDLEILEAQNKINKLINKLKSTDYLAIKFAEQEITFQEFYPTKMKRKEWREEINNLQQNYNL